MPFRPKLPMSPRKTDMYGLLSHVSMKLKPLQSQTRIMYTVHEQTNEFLFIFTVAVILFEHALFLIGNGYLMNLKT